ncbi:MAG: sigma-54 dependent transcriptional regulator [Deltaproteobacteria bacterium]|jgi:DNA-binding NtrC family response regulator|nr:sigma-54 dependent transcriptional regulator [Deltaproteobacteria bacterium]
MRILVVDDNKDSLHSLSLVLRDLGHETVATQDPRVALEEARKNFYPLIISDIRMQGMSGLDLLNQLKNGDPPVESDVLLITGYADMETAVQALRGGAYDYLNKPINAAELSVVVERCAEHQKLMLENITLKDNLDKAEEASSELRDSLAAAREQLREVFGVGEVVADSPQMRSLMDQAMIFHNSPATPVLIEGETGTGKEILARLIHYGQNCSDHFGKSGADAPFVALNCSAIPHELFGSELFGHEPGAFTGSRAEGAAGKLEMAGSGTLFLDEISEMPWDMQPKLLRVLEDRSFYRLGGKRERKFKARVVCAGNRSLEEMVRAGQFRRDLYHRLSVGYLYIPPLRERGSELEALAALFLMRESRLKKKNFSGISREALEMMRAYPWLGNVRELRNAVERAVLLNDGGADGLLRPEHLAFISDRPPDAAPRRRATDRLPGQPSDQLFGQPSTQPSGHPLGQSSGQLPDQTPGQPLGLLTDPVSGYPLSEDLQLPEQAFDLEELYDVIVRKAVEKFNGNKSKAAEYLNISRFSLHRRLKKEE